MIENHTKIVLGLDSDEAGGAFARHFSCLISSTQRLAVYGHVAVAIMGGLGGVPASQQDAAKLLLYGLPIASFIGAGLAFSQAQLSALLLLGSAVGWYAIGAKFGYGFNVITATAIILDGLAGLFAVGSIGNQTKQRKRHYGEVLVSKLENRSPYAEELKFDNPPHANYDVRKWEALLTKYDDNLAQVHKKFSVLGKQWQDEFAREYLATNDKTYLSSNRDENHLRCQSGIQLEAERTGLDNRQPANSGTSWKRPP